MHLDEMILVSVDDHIIEPRDLSSNGTSPASGSGGARVWSTTRSGAWRRGPGSTVRRGQVVHQHRRHAAEPRVGLRARVPRPRSARAATTVKERVRDMDANGGPRLALLPLVPRGWRAGSSRSGDRSRSRARLRPGLQRLAHRRLGARRLPRSFHPARRSPPIWKTARPGGRRGPARRAEGRDGDHLHRGHGGLRSPRASTPVRTILLRGLRRRRVWSSRSTSASCGTGGFPGRDSGSRSTCATRCRPGTRSRARANLLWSHLREKYPDLKFALSEGGTSWIPGFLDRMERHYHVQRWAKPDLGGLTPTEVFRAELPRLLHLRPLGSAAPRSHRHRQHRL